MSFLNFKLYAFVSTLLTGGAVINSYSIHEQFFPTVIYLTTQKSNKLIISNFFLMLGLAILIKCIDFFFGEVREIERINILESVKRKMVDVLFIILIYRESVLDSSFFFWMMILVFFWIVHQLTIKRSEYLIAESITDPTMHMKLCFMYFFLICVDSIVLRYMHSMNQLKTDDSFASSTQSSASSSTLMLLFFLEFMIIAINLVYPTIRYLINAFEMFSYSHFAGKDNLLMVLEFIFTIAMLITQLVMRIKFQFYFPFIVDHLHTIHTLYSTIAKFISSMNLLRLLNKLPDVSLEDVADVDNTCLICLSEITEGKKIGCGHIFHKSCLRELIQGKSNQVCPKCRKPIQIEQIAATPPKDKAATDNNNNNNNQHHQNTQDSIQQNLANYTPQNAERLLLHIQKKKGPPKQQDFESKNERVSAVTDSFSFNMKTIEIYEGENIDEILKQITKAIKEEQRLPQIIKRIKSYIDQIEVFQSSISEEKPIKIFSLADIIDTNYLLENSHTSLKRCGGLSFGLPQEAVYNRSCEDECLRLKIELMNLLLTSCHTDLLLQSLFFGATKNPSQPKPSNPVSSEQPQRPKETEIVMEKQQKLPKTQPIIHKAQSNIEKQVSNFNEIQNPTQISSVSQQIPLSTTSPAVAIDTIEDEKTRRQRWIERMQESVHAAAAAAAAAAQDSSQLDHLSKHQSTPNPTNKDSD